MSREKFYSLYKNPARRKMYERWHQLKGRCTNPQHRTYPRYGGRGIGVCERWLVFDNFYADMGDPPFPKATIDRIDNDKGYSPENCRWATYGNQNSNKRKAKWSEERRRKQLGG